MNWLRNIFTAIRKLPVARYLKPLWKGALLEAIERGGNLLQESLRKKLEKDGPKELNQVVDRWQVDMVKTIGRLPLPNRIAGKCADWIRFEGDRLQKKIVPAAIAGGAEALDRVFDESQSVLVSKVEAL